MKPGFFSSEFTAFMAGLAATVLNKKLGLDIDPSILLGLFSTIAVYIGQRGWVKTKPAPSLVVEPQGLPPFMASAEMSKKMLADQAAK